MSAALAQLLASLAARIPPPSIDSVWIFPPRELRGRESGLVLLALELDGPGNGGRFRLVTLRYEARHESGGLRIDQELIEQGSAPAERIERVIAGVLRRLGDAPEIPRAVRIEGDPARWERLLAESLGAEPEPRPAARSGA